MAQPEIAVLVSSFERPGHLRRVLASLAAQRGVGRRFEVVVTDDGSRDDTPHMVQWFASAVDFPVQLVTHPHDGFQLARCRNEGVAASTAPYLLFLDGDCVLPPDHLRTHLDRRRERCAMAGYYIYLSQAATERIDDADIHSGRFLNEVDWPQRLSLKWRHLRSEFYSLIRDPARPKLLGGNLGIARSDYERINGYDENFRGWGCEDDDLRLRLRAAGVGVASISWWTNPYHLWHPKTPSAPETWREGANVDYFQRPLRLTHCLAGLKKRRLEDLDVRIVGRRPDRNTLDRLLPRWCHVAVSTYRKADGPAEIELAFAGGDGRFSEGPDCRVLIVPRGEIPTQPMVQEADLVFADQAIGGWRREHCFPLNRFDTVMHEQLRVAPVAIPRTAEAILA